MTIKPAPIIAIPNVPATRVTIKRREFDVLVIVRRSRCSASLPWQYRYLGDWT